MKKVIYIQLVQVASLALSILVTPQYLQFLGKSEYGFTILFAQIITYLNIFDFGIGNWLLQKVSANLVTPGADSSNFVRRGYHVLFAILLVMVPLMALLAYRIDHLVAISLTDPVLSKSLFFLALVASLLSLFFKPLVSLQLANEHLSSNATVNFITLCIFSLGSLWLLHLGLGINSFFIAHIASVLVGLATNIAFLQFRNKLAIYVGWPSKTDAYTTLSGSFYIFLNAISAQIIYNGDRAILANFVALSTLSLFSLNIRIAEVGQLSLIKLTDTYLPKVIKAANLSVDVCLQYYQTLTRFIVLVALLFITNALCFNEAFLKLWVGAEWLLPNGNLMLALYCMVLFAHVVFRIPSIFLFGMASNKGYTKTSFADAALNLVLSIVLVKYFDVIGVVIGTLVATLLTSVPANILLFKRALNTTDALRRILLPILLPVLISLPFVAGSFALFQYLHPPITSWLCLIAIAIALNLILIPLLILANFGRFKNLKLQLKFLHNEFHR